jgi:hypothetical protein
MFGPENDVEKIRGIVQELRRRRREVPKEAKLGWYYRY